LSWEAVCKRLGRAPEEIYKEICQDLFRLGVANNFELSAIAGGASNRGYLRVRFDSQASRQSLVIMVLSQLNPKQGIEEVVDGSVELKELPFLNVQRYFYALGIAVPKVFYTNQQAGLIYLEDLGDILLRDELIKADYERKKELLTLAIDELLKIHLQTSSLSASDFIGFKVRFDRDLLRWELEHFKEWALIKRGIKITSSDLKLLDECFEKIVSELVSTPYLLSHRDYHIDNLLIHQGRIRVIDFQDALMAPYPYDLASLLYDRDTSQILGLSLIEEMVRYYFERACELGWEPHSFEQYERCFNLCLVHRSFKVVGRFYFLAEAKAKPEYLKFLPAVYQVLSQALSRFEEFYPVKQMLSSYLPELAGV